MKLMTLFESKQTEDDGKRILKTKGVSDSDIENIINDFKNGDTSQNQKNIPIMCFFYGEGNNQLIINEINNFNDLIIKQKINLKSYNSNELTVIYKERTVVNNEVKEENVEKTFTPNNWIEFTELIHGLSQTLTSKKYNVSFKKEEVTNLPIFLEGDNIKIYEARGKNDCIKYTHALTNKTYRFCIGNPSPVSNMYNTYRTRDGAKFYFILDLDRMDEKNDPLHMVVLQTNTIPSRHIILTDENNTSGFIAEYGKDVDAYLKYLESKGIDTDKFEFVELTEAEKYTNKLVRNQISDIDTLLSLDNPNNPNYRVPETEIESDKENYYLRQYIDQGHQLTDEQFNFFLERSSDM
jgi:hypothetical protein